MILDEDKYVEAIVIVFCVAAVGIGLSYSAPPHQDYQAWVSDYPKQASVGAAIDFSLWLQGPDGKSFTADVYVDDLLAGSRQVFATQQASQYQFSIQGDLVTGGTHAVSVRLYDPSQTTYTPNSRFTPYELFFQIDVV
jgi:hypothetical protein